MKMRADLKSIMLIFMVCISFLVGSGAGQYCIRQISINLRNGSLISTNSIIHQLLLIAILGFCQLVYVRALYDYPLNILYPCAVGSSVIGVILMSTLTLGEKLDLESLLGISMIISGIIIISTRK